jgi:excisionase family DNA binding protein
MTVKGERSESAGPNEERPLTGSTETTPSHVGEAEAPPLPEGLAVSKDENLDASPIAARLPLVLTIEEAAERLGIGRTVMYGLVSSGAVESVRIGRLRRVPVDALGAFLDELRRIQRGPAA